jgi:hypothetical protein
LLENRQEPRQVMKDTTAYILTDMMRDTVRVGTGTRFRFEDVKMPIAGKTGTSSDTVDLGFTGYTPYYAATVWLGFDQQKEIRENNQHRDLWRKVMEDIHRNLPEKEFNRPNGLVSVDICIDSGKLVSEICRRDPRGNRIQKELFVSTHQPQDFCDDHVELRICNVSGQRAGYGCHDWGFKIGVTRMDRMDADVVILDSDYVFTASMLHRSECAYCGFGGWPGFNYNGGLPDDIGNPFPSMGDIYGHGAGTNIPGQDLMDFQIPQTTVNPWDNWSFGEENGETP